jgi:hypothetical protein
LLLAIFSAITNQLPCIVVGGLPNSSRARPESKRLLQLQLPKNGTAFPVTVQVTNEDDCTGDKLTAIGFVNGDAK